MLTRKHFNAIAQAFAETSGDYENPEVSQAVTAVRAYLAMAIADISANENPRFDAQRFYKACKV